MSEARVAPGRVPVWLVAGMFAVGSAMFVAERYSENKAGDRLRDAVSKASQVRLNGDVVADPTILLATLRLVDHVTAHHSHPNALIRIDLVNGASATQIAIARDSQNPSEFWTYLPGPNWYLDKRGQAAGRITSTDLDRFLRERGL